MEFVCGPCSVAGDAAAEYRRDGVFNERREAACQAMHGKCKGGTWCDCQHRTK